MRDASTRAEPSNPYVMRMDTSEKIWVTKENDTLTLFEFNNKHAFKADTANRTYKLPHSFKVTRLCLTELS